MLILQILLIIYLGADTCNFESEFWGLWLAILHSSSQMLEFTVFQYKGQILAFASTFSWNVQAFQEQTEREREREREREKQERICKRQGREDLQVCKGPFINCFGSQVL